MELNKTEKTGGKCRAVEGGGPGCHCSHNGSAKKQDAKDDEVIDHDWFSKINKLVLYHFFNIHNYLPSINVTNCHEAVADMDRPGRLINW